MRARAKPQPQPEFHVVPLGDDREHVLTIECWCLPDIDPQHPQVLIHNAADGREAYENGTRKPH